MKKIFALVALSLSVCGYAQAHDPVENDQILDATAYTCTVQGDMAGASLGLGLGGQFISGPGMITCTAGDVVRSMPVRMRLIGGGLALIDFTIVRSLRIYSAALGVIGGPEALLHTYNVGVTAGVTLLSAGVTFDTAVRVSACGGLSFELAFQGQDAIGLGARLHGMVLAIEPR